MINQFHTQDTDVFNFFPVLRKLGDLWGGKTEPLMITELKRAFPFGSFYTGKYIVSKSTKKTKIKLYFLIKHKKSKNIVFTNNIWMKQFPIIYGFVKGCLKTKVTSLFANIFLMKAFGQKRKQQI